jgi:DNA-directed RNA polymerase subunit H
MATELKQYKSTGHVQWDVYNIVRDAFCPYRGIKIKTPTLTHADLIKNMQFDMYVKIVGETSKGNKIVITILARNEKGVNEIATMTDKFRLFINSIKEQESEIIIISPCKFQTHVLNFISDNGLTKRIHRYNYDHFKVVVPLGPYCSPHRILSSEEAQKQIDLHKLDQKEMKKILSSDPQIIWLGAQPGDIIWIDRINPLSGLSSDIRRVIRGEIL